MKLRTLLVSSLLLGTCVAVSAETTAALNSGVSGGRLIAVGNQHNPAHDATRCVQIQDARNGANFYNSCNFAVELTWCVEGVDCNPGYSNTWTLGAGRQWPIQGTSKQRRQIYYAACKGANSFNHTSDLGRHKQHSCE